MPPLPLPCERVTLQQWNQRLEKETQTPLRLQTWLMVSLIKSHHQKVRLVRVEVWGKISPAAIVEAMFPEFARHVLFFPKIQRAIGHLSTKSGHVVSCCTRRATRGYVGYVS